MEKLNRKIIYVLTALMSSLLIITSVNAQEHKEERRAAMQEIRDYIESNVLPVLQEKRQELDSKLSLEDRELLSTIRLEIREERQNAKEFRKELREALDKEIPLTDAQKIRFADMHLAKQNMQRQVRPIAERNEEVLRASLESIKPKSDKWKNDIEAIRKSHGLEERGEFKQRRRKRGGIEKSGNRDRKEHEKKGRGGMHKLRQLTKPTGFLLWDGSIKADDDFGREELSDVMVYPNPANSTPSNITFSITDDSKVNVVLIDSNGEEVKTLIDKKLSAGEHTLKLDTNDLENGVYFYRINSSSGTRTKRFVVRK